jgi:hypothetical protein
MPAPMSRSAQLFQHSSDRYDALMGVLKMPPDFLRLHGPRFFGRRRGTRRRLPSRAFFRFGGHRFGSSYLPKNGDEMRGK